MSILITSELAHISLVIYPIFPWAQVWALGGMAGWLWYPQGSHPKILQVLQQVPVTLRVWSCSSTSWGTPWKNLWHHQTPLHKQPHWAGSSQLLQVWNIFCLSAKSSWSSSLCQSFTREGETELPKAWHCLCWPWHHLPPSRLGKWEPGARNEVPTLDFPEDFPDFSRFSTLPFLLGKEPTFPLPAISSLVHPTNHNSFHYFEST